MACDDLELSHYAARADHAVRDTTVGAVLIEAAAAASDVEALVEVDLAGLPARRWTYGELLLDAERLAAALFTRYHPGERICVWAPNLPEWVILQYAAGLAGLTLVTANPAYQPRELKYVLEQSRAVGLFFVGEYRGNPMARIAAEVAAGLPAVRELVDLEDRAALYAGEALGAALPPVRPRDPAQIQYTSGTTGFPKGVVLHHCGITNNARFSNAAIGLRSGDTLVTAMPLFHAAGSVFTTLGVAQFGARLILARIFDPDVVLDVMACERATVLLGVPTMLIAMLEAQARRPRDLASVRMAISGGTMVPPELVRRVREVFGCDFHIVYGQTEASCLLAIAKCCDGALEDEHETVGRPIAQTEISIRDTGSDAVLPIGAVGEICVRGYGTLLEYNDNPQATAAALDADGWLHTGDLGAMDAHGRLRVTGRVKEMIIRGGENLFPAEIENVLLEHPDVAEAAVVGVPDERWGEIVVAFLRPAPGAPTSSPALSLRRRIARVGAACRRGGAVN